MITGRQQRSSLSWSQLKYGHRAGLRCETTSAAVRTARQLSGLAAVSRLAMSRSPEPSQASSSPARSGLTSRTTMVSTPNWDSKTQASWS